MAIFVQGTASPAADEWLETAAVGPVPQSIRNQLGLKDFYVKHVDAMGIPVMGSSQVSDGAVIEAAYLIRCMLQNAPEIAERIAKNRVRVAVMSCAERTRMVPEHSDLDAKFDKRARGLGATTARPASSCAEENLLGCTGDPYRLENVFVHEFSHTIHLMGLGPDFDKELKQTYNHAMETRKPDGTMLWMDAVRDGQPIPTYASTNYEEYWAEGVQAYFGCNWPEPDVSHNGINGREQLAEYDRDLHDLIDRTLNFNLWNYIKPKDRANQPHLTGPGTESLAFAWTPADLALDA